jgi:UDP-2,4-diacetamido-2,4,6-trideoxy-beta-L-altropyranose hydrolase
MAQLMAAADLALGAGGSATWERCAIGLPAIVTVVAENQLEVARTGAEHGLFFYLGEAKEVSPKRLAECLNTFLAAPENLLGYVGNSLALVDAKGAQRVTGALIRPEITIRPAALADCDSVYEWRNAEETRRYIFDAEPIPLEKHRQWFRSTLDNPDRVLLIGEVDGQAVGVLRYDLCGEQALISVYLVPGGQGQGLGSQLIRCGSQWLRNHHPQVKIINAEIFKENVASARAFGSAGYEEHHRIFREVL